MIEAAAVRRVAARFRIGAPVDSVEPLPGGHIHDTFLVTTAVGDDVVQRLNRSVLPDLDGPTANVVVVHRHLGGTLVPEPVPARDGGWLVREGGDTWRAWVRVRGATPAGPPTRDRVGSAGRLLGTFHAALADLDPGALVETLPGFHDLARRLGALHAVVGADPCGRVAGAGAEIEAALAAAPLAERARAVVAGVPRRVAHNDAKLDNVLFRGDDAVALVDLDTLMPGAWCWDVGDLLRSASTTAAEDDPDPEHAVVDPVLHEAVLAGYREGVGGAATTAELEALAVAGALVTYEQALRFLADWLAGDVYYRTTRPGQNLDRARNQLGLLASMPGTVTA